MSPKYYSYIHIFAPILKIHLLYTYVFYVNIYSYTINYELSIFYICSYSNSISIVITFYDSGSVIYTHSSTINNLIQLLYMMLRFRDFSYTQAFLQKIKKRTKETQRRTQLYLNIFFNYRSSKVFFFKTTIRPKVFLNHNYLKLRICKIAKSAFAISYSRIL